MKIYHTGKGSEVIKVAGGRSNSWMIRSLGESILVDTGVRMERKILFRNIERVLLHGEKLDYLVLTHTHFDHCLNAAAIKLRFGASIVVNHNEASYLADGYTPIPAGTNPFTSFLSDKGRKLGRRPFSYDPVDPDIIFKEEHILGADPGRIRIVSTPGHSKGSCCIIVDNEICLAGDTLFGVFRRSVYPPFADNVPLMLKAWTDLISTGCRLFLPGHGRAITLERLEDNLQRYRME